MGILKKGQFAALLACTGLVACNSGEKKETPRQPEQEAQQIESPQEQPSLDDIDIPRLSEALGHFIGRNLKSPGVQFNLEKIINGMREGAAGKPSPMSDEEYEMAMAKLQQKVYENLSETNLAAANKFLTENVNVQGVKEIVPGKLQYMILQEGSGPVVPERGTPSINYTGKFIDGSVFGSSENSGGPISVPIDQTIQGFSKGIAGMKEGEKRRLYVHPDLGYGKGGQLPPNTLLIFDIEVVKANAADKEQTTTTEKKSEESDQDSSKRSSSSRQVEQDTLIE